MDARIQMSGAYYVAPPAVLRLLFVDDDPILREFAVVHLSSETMSVETAQDGVDGLEAVAAQQPDVVLLDLEMPRADGFEVLRQLRADPATARLPVVVATGREDIAAIDRAFEAGATTFVTKPLNWRLLSYQVRYVHRAHCNETYLLEERRRMIDRATQATSALKAVAQESSSFLGTALRAQPDLRGPAQRYADVVAAASGLLGEG